MLAPIFLIILFTAFQSLSKKEFNISSITNRLKKNRYSALAFFFGFFFHLLEDMPTPASVWDGVNLFFPSSEYIGDYGKIWWWNNYDLVLIIFSVIVLNLIVNLIQYRYYKIKALSSISVFSIGLVLFVVQINTRPISFAYRGHTIHYQKFEEQSKNIQKEILGDKLFQIMTDIDNKIPLNF